jgi:hypothetical protein
MKIVAIGGTGLIGAKTSSQPRPEATSTASRAKGSKRGPGIASIVSGARSDPRGSNVIRSTPTALGSRPVALKAVPPLPRGCSPLRASRHPRPVVVAPMRR